MHSLFNLVSGSSEDLFRDSLEQLSTHLVNSGFLLSTRFMKHQAHPGYNADAPATGYYLAMEFTDMQQAQSCWDYIESDREPVSTLHKKMRSHVCDSSFFLYHDV